LEKEGWRFSAGVVRSFFSFNPQSAIQNPKSVEGWQPLRLTRVVRAGTRSVHEAPDGRKSQLKSNKKPGPKIAIRAASDSG
jgi:hypothetical protein